MYNILLVQVFNAVKQVLPLLNPYLEYTLDEIVGEYNYALWDLVVENNYQSGIGKQFMKAVHCGRFTPLRCLNPSSRGANSKYLYQLDECD